MGVAVILACVFGKTRSASPNSSVLDPLDIASINSGRVWQLVAIGCLAGGVAFSLGFLARSVSHRVGHVATARLWKDTSQPIPLLGIIPVLAGVAVGLFAGARDVFGSPRFGATALGFVAIGAVGFRDDSKGLTPRTRLFWTAIVAELAWLMGLRAQVFGDGSAGTVANAAVTMLWIVAVTHAFNIFDNVDGALGAVAAASAFSLSMLAVLSDQWLVASLALAMTGACLGFLIHNVHKARLYLGDAGALSIGFFLACLGLVLKPIQQRPLGFALPLLALALPLFDVALVTLARLRAGRPVAHGGTDHLSHRLIALRLTVRSVGVVLFVTQLALGAIALVIATSSQQVGWVILTIVGAAALVTLRTVLRLPEWREHGAFKTNS